ncbi:MAG: FecR family protein [Acidovorax sp.]
MSVPIPHSSNDGPPPLMAGGLPISEAVADQAAEWLTLLMSGEATAADRQRWQQWRAAHTDHERAWRHIEAVTQRLKLLEPRAGYQTLSPYAGPKGSGRRKALNLLLWGGAAGAAALLASRTQTWQRQVADYRSGIGEQRVVTLQDGSRITLNTASAIDVRFDGQRRLLRLVAGEVLVATGRALGHAGDPRPFVVETAEGRIRALGTRFGVRQQDGRTSVAVLESAVEITPADGGTPRILQAGERASFTRAEVEAPQAVAERDGAWARGQIVAEDTRLDDFLAELGRYRAGLVRCAPEVAGLRLSGVFPLNDTDRILATLPSVLPVQVRLRTRWWVTVEAAG